jgi:acyl carrier protein
MDYMRKIIELISLRAGMEVTEITPEMFLEDDLNIGEMEVSELVQELEEEYKIDLAEELKSVETVIDLVAAVEEKIE